MLSLDLVQVCVLSVAVGLASLVKLLLQLCAMGVLHRFDGYDTRQKEFSVTRVM